MSRGPRLSKQPNQGLNCCRDLNRTERGEAEDLWTRLFTDPEHRFSNFGKFHRHENADCADNHPPSLKRLVKEEKVILT